MSVVHPNSHVVSTPSASRPRQPAIHAAGLSTRSQPPRRSASSYHPSSSSTANPRFSHLFNTVLGSPFLTTTDIDHGLGPPDPDLDLVDGTPHAVPRTLTITRPSSPASTADFSIIDVDPDDEEARYPYRYAYQGYSGGRPGGHGRSVSSLSTFGKRGTYPLPNPGLGGSNTGTTPLKSILPRIWDALSSPARSFTPSPSPPPTPTPSTRYYAYGKGKAPSLDHHVYTPAGYIDYSDLPPLDGEEGELIAIDDEACFIDVTAVTGIGESIVLQFFAYILVHAVIVHNPRGTLRGF
jgi:F-box and WD-40 domain protein 1/11